MVLPIPRVKPAGWGLFEILTSSQETQLDLNISLLDQEITDLTVSTQQNLAHSSLQAWRFFQPPRSGANGSTQVVPVGVGAGIGQRLLFTFEADTTHSSNTYFASSSDGAWWSGQVAISPSYVSMTDAVAGIPGTILACASAGIAIAYTSDFGGTWTKANVSTSNGLAVHYGLGQYWLLQAGRAIRTANAPSGLNGSATVIVPTPGTGTFTGLPEFADNGANTICCVANSSAVSYPSVYVSTDLGATWIKAFDLTGATAANLVFDSVRGKFVTWSDDGSISYSADGATWTRTSTSASAGNGFFVGQRTFAVTGHVIAKLWREVVGGIGVNGIAYSFNLGVDWFVFAFGNSGQPINQLRAANNRFYALDAFSLWISGIVDEGIADF